MAAPAIRLVDVDLTFVPGNLTWPFPDMLAICQEARGAVWVADPAELGNVWPAGTRLYRKRSESQLGPEVDAMANAFRGAEYTRLTDVEMYEWRIPQIQWREPIRVPVEEGRRAFFCRLCVVQQGLTDEQIMERAMSEGDAIAHIEREHCSPPKEGEG